MSNLIITRSKLVGGFNPSQKKKKNVNWNGSSQDMKQNTSHFPNHQPNRISFYPSTWGRDGKHQGTSLGHAVRQLRQARGRRPGAREEARGIDLGVKGVEGKS